MLPVITIIWITNEILMEQFHTILMVFIVDVLTLSTPLVVLTHTDHAGHLTNRSLESDICTILVNPNVSVEQYNELFTRVWFNYYEKS